MKRAFSLFAFLFLVIMRNSILFAQAPISGSEINPEYQKWIRERVFQSQSKEPATGLNPNPLLIHTELSPDLLDKLTNRLTAAPSFDLRNTGGVTSVKNQGNCGSCWAFATMGSIESVWLINNKGNFDLSEDNLNTCHVPFIWEPCGGGNSYMSAAYLSRGSGPISESDDPYSDSHYTVDCPSGLTPQAIVSSAWFLPNNDPEFIKYLITQYGALFTTFYWTSSSYNATNYTYYYSGASSPNHAVTLVGWDDSKVTAAGTGAWIIKNSWGEYWGENGYFYIAYQDSKVNSELALFKDYIEYDPDLKVSTYSESGWVGNVFGISSTNSADALTKFIAEDNIQLTRVGTYTGYPGSIVTIDIYDSFNGSNSLTGLLGSIPAQTCSFTGYNSFDLASPINIGSGDDYYIKVNYQTPGYNYPVPFEEVISGYANPPISAGIFWAKSTTSSSWFSLDPYSMDPCVYSYSIKSEDINPPSILTSPVNSITIVSAISGGNIIDNGGSAITSRGVCWSTAQNPTTADSNTSDGNDLGSYISTVSGLSPGTTYYLRAYANNIAGTGYGEEISFRTYNLDAIQDIEGNYYNIVNLGDKNWLAENLKTTRFNDGNSIPNVTDNEEWGDLTTPGYRFYDNNIGNMNIYGALYNWYTVNTGILCPTGWHIPNNLEWIVMSTSRP